MKYVLFKCDWFGVNNSNSGIKMDKYGFTFINTNSLILKWTLCTRFTSKICVLCGGSVREGLGCSSKKAPRDFYNMPDKDSIASNDVICDQNESYNIREDEDMYMR